jgi:cobalt/nickel transport system permease protein
MIAAVLLILRSRRVTAAPGDPAPRLDPRVKLAAMLGLVLTAVLLPPSEAGKVGLLALFALGWVLGARVSARWLAGRALLLLPFLGLTALSLPALRESGQGFSLVGLVYLRAATSLLATAAFLATTPESDVLAALRAFRLPRALAETLTFALRYMRVLLEEAGRMLQARTARGAGVGTLALRAGGTGGIVGTLFLRSMERADRVSLAMAARGYSGQMPKDERTGLGTADWGFLAGTALFLAGVWLWR